MMMDFLNVKPALHRWDKLHLAFTDYPLNIYIYIYCWMWYAKYFVKDFFVCFRNGYWSVVFFIMLSSGFDIRVILASQTIPSYSVLKDV